jgi:hypothetical protein
MSNCITPYTLRRQTMSSQCKYCLVSCVSEPARHNVFAKWVLVTRVSFVNLGDACSCVQALLALLLSCTQILTSAAACSCMLNKEGFFCSVCLSCLTSSRRTTATSWSAPGYAEPTFCNWMHRCSPVAKTISLSNKGCIVNIFHR